MSNVDMWVGMRSAWHSKSLERRCQTAVRMFPGCYYTRCALIRTDVIHMQFRLKQRVFCVSTLGSSRCLNSVCYQCQRRGSSCERS